MIENFTQNPINQLSESALLMLGLEYLVKPYPIQQFIAEVFGRKALLVEGDASKFERLFSWDDINDVLNHGRMSLEGVRLLYEKNNLDSSQLANLEHWLNQGATLVINNVNQIDRVLGQFASSLESDLSTRININSYTSCPAKQGFDIHFDRHDVFIVQTEGSKKWVVFEPTKLFPIHNQKDQDKGPPPETEPYLECTLNCGDVLYIPRGHWHYAIAETPSIHLTVGPQSRNGAEFLQWLVTRITDSDDFLRMDFPLAYSKLLSGEDDLVFNEHFEKFRDHVVDLVSRESLKEAFIEYCMEQHPYRRKHQLPNLWSLESTIDLNTRFFIPSEQKLLLRYDEKARTARVLTRGKNLTLDSISPEVLEIVFGQVGREFTGKEILAVNSDYSEKRIREILIDLYKNGVIVLAEV